MQSLAVPIASATHFWTPWGSIPISAMQSITVVAISPMHPQPSPISQTPSGVRRDSGLGTLLKIASSPLLYTWQFSAWTATATRRTRQMTFMLTIDEDSREGGVQEVQRQGDRLQEEDARRVRAPRQGRRRGHRQEELGERAPRPRRPGLQHAQHDELPRGGALGPARRQGGGEAVLPGHGGRQPPLQAQEAGRRAGRLRRHDVLARLVQQAHLGGRRMTRV